MFHAHSLTARIGVAIVTGLLIGAIIQISLQMFGATYPDTFGYGLWLFYVLLSLTIALMGLFTRHPIFGFRMYWWMRGTVLGVAYHLLLVLLAYDIIASFMTLPAVSWFGLTNPFWMLIDGAVAGMLIAGVTTKLIGEGNLPLK